MTEQERFGRCLAVVLRLEGGYGEDPRDPGGATNLGVTRATLAQALGRPVSRQEVMELTRPQAAAIYRDRYWAAIRCGELAAGLDLMLFDTAVNMGPAVAVRLLQAAVGTVEDGLIGPRTLAAAAEARRGEAIAAMAGLRRRRYRMRPGFAAFGRGWTARVEAVEAQALSWAGADAAVAGGDGQAA